MGPRNSIESKVKQQQFFSNYQIIQQIQSENIRFLQHKQTKKQYLLRQLNYNDQKQYLKAIDTINNKKQQLKNADHITAITDFFSNKVDGYCSNFYKIYVLFEYPQRTLDDEINERNLRKNNFSETQIWSILASCILGLGHLQKKGIRHSSLKSSMIFLSQQGVIKISDPFTTGCQTNYETLLNKRGAKHIYLSPQQCQSLQKQMISPVINPYKSDIFTLGMIILQCGLLQYQDECYRDQCSRIHWETLQYNKNRFRRAYSQELANMLEYMLGAEANNRPEWIELENYVITDNGAKSFISEGRKSNLIGYSKPVSVNIQKLMMDGSQAQINTINTAQKLANIQHKNIHTNNVSSNMNKGLRISSSKPSSIIRPSYQNPVTETKRKEVITELRPSTTIFNGQSAVKPILIQPVQQQQQQVSQFTTNTLRPLPTNFLSPTQTKIFSESQTKTSNSQSDIIKRFDIKPLNPSNINMTRPFKSIFPVPFYETKSKADENLIQLQEQDDASQTVSVSGSDNYSQSNQYSYTKYQQTNKIIGPQSNTSSSNGQVFQISPFISNSLSTTINQNSQNYQKFQKKIFEGQFVVETFKLGSRYEGYKLNGMRHGPGKFFYQDGGMYDGNWVRNKMQGFGRLYYQSGKLAYEGEWIQDQFKGHGILYNQNPDQLTGPFNYQNFDDVQELWTKYQGEFDDDSKNGKGLLYLSNGQYFQGLFVNDTAQGQGVYRTVNGQRVHGIWQNNRLVQRI